MPDITHPEAVSGPMTDQMRLDVIAYHKWAIVWIDGGQCIIVTKNGSTKPYDDIRKAITAAIRLPTL